MPITPNMKQRDLVRLALLVCGDRPGEKYRPLVKGSESPYSVTSPYSSKA